jgi:transposase InsO family protein
VSLRKWRRQACYGWLQIRMENAATLTKEQIQQFLLGSEGMKFGAETRTELYRWVEQVLVAQEYTAQGRNERGVIRAFVRKMTGLSLAQTTRLIGKYRQDGLVHAVEYRRKRFPTKYTSGDLALLAELDCAHDWLSGPATLRILKRENEVFGKTEYARLSKISVGHLYNLRNSAGYRKLAAKWEPTHAAAAAIGERRKPDPQGRPGFLRIDTVHQGDWNGVKGVYHINAVDTVTQWQVVGCVGRISEENLKPVLEAILHQFPLKILGFHSDNGSEYVNYGVAKMLQGLLIEFTRSRANRTTDNALVEGKNGAIIRKQLGYGYIGAEHAEQVQKFFMAYLNPYLNFHRPCGFATVSLDAKGKRKREYQLKDYATPYEKWKSLLEPERYLKEKMTFARLDEAVGKLSDTECARKMRAAKGLLLRRCKHESPVAQKTE